MLRGLLPPRIYLLPQGGVRPSRRGLSRGDPDRYQDRGVAYFWTGEYDRAIADFDRAIQIDPNAILPYQFRGYAHKWQGNSSLARADFEKALEIDPEHEAARGSLQELEQPKDAEGPDWKPWWDRQDRGDRRDGYRKSNYILDNKALGWVVLGNDRWRSAWDDQAITCYTQAIRIDPDNSIAYFHRGYSYRENGNLDRAIADYTQALQIDPNDSAAYSNRGDTERLVNRTGPVAGSRVYFERGTAYSEKGKYDQAIADFTKAIRLAPGGWTFTTIEIDPSGGIIWDAETQTQDESQAIKNEPHYRTAYFERGNLYRGRGNYDQAIADYTEVIAAYNLGPVLWRPRWWRMPTVNKLRA